MDHANFKRTPETTFEELLAFKVSSSPDEFVYATTEAFKKGVPAAINLVNEAILNNRYKEEGVFPLTDEQYAEVIKVAAAKLSGVPKAQAAA